MDIQELKNFILNKQLDDNLLILNYENTDFICHQYCTEISKNKNLDIEYIQNLDVLVDSLDDIFESQAATSLRIFKCDNFCFNNIKLNDIKNLIIITKNVDKETRKLYTNIVDIPKLEEWQIKDYIYSICKGIEQKKLDRLISCCPDMYKLQNEIDKLLLFEDKRDIIFNKYLQDGVFSDLSNYTIFDFTDALVHKDIVKLNQIYQERFNCDIEPLGVLTIMIKKFKNFVNIRLAQNATYQSCGLSSGAFYYAQRDSKIYTNTQIIKIYEQLLDIERKLKTGILSEENMIDYIAAIILTA